MQIACQNQIQLDKHFHFNLIKFMLPSYPLIMFKSLSFQVRNFCEKSKVGDETEKMMQEAFKLA